MEVNVKLDDVLDLLATHQEELAVKVDAETTGYRAHTVLWEEYKHVSVLYDNIRRAAE